MQPFDQEPRLADITAQISSFSMQRHRTAGVPLTGQSAARFHRSQPRRQRQNLVLQDGHQQPCLRRISIVNHTGIVARPAFVCRLNEPLLA
jgi:hypothetical protein